jgi:hypothetical protein
MLQAARSRVRFLMSSLDFSIDLILPTALMMALGGIDSASNRNYYPGIEMGVKGLPAREVDNLTAICEPIV